MEYVGMLATIKRLSHIDKHKIDCINFKNR